MLFWPTLCLLLVVGMLAACGSVSAASNITSRELNLAYDQTKITQPIIRWADLVGHIVGLDDDAREFIK